MINLDYTGSQGVVKRHVRDIRVLWASLLRSYPLVGVYVSVAVLWRILMYWWRSDHDGFRTKAYLAAGSIVKDDAYVSRGACPVC